MSLLAHLLDYLLGKVWHNLENALNKKDEFLVYDVNVLLNSYSDQHGRFLEHIPYSEEAIFIKDSWTKTLDHSKLLKVQCLDPWFRLAQPDNDVAKLQQAAYERMVALGMVKGPDTTVVRLSNFDPESQTLALQRAKYSMQARSNLIVDWKGSKKGPRFEFSLRELLRAKYGRQLPPWNENLLVNSVGIAIVLLFKAESGEYLPYLQKRAANLAVFPKAFHCTASGATRAPLKHAWESATFTFDEVFSDDVYHELNEEVGIRREHVQDLIPVALCREYLRAGKPQIFFAGLTDMCVADLKKARIEAMKRKGWKDIKEIEKAALIPSSFKELQTLFRKPRITLETLPALYYADLYAKVRLSQTLGVSA